MAPPPDEERLGAALLEETPRRRQSSARTIMILLAFGKFVAAVGFQSVQVFAPFLAKEAGDLTLKEYRLGFLALDMSFFVQLLLPLQDIPPRKLAAIAFFVHAVAVLVPQTLLLGAKMPLALATCRFFQGLANTSFAIVANSILGTFPEELRTRAIALTEMAFFLAGFAVPVYGELLEHGSGLLATSVMIVLPSLLLVVLCTKFLPDLDTEANSPLVMTAEKSTKSMRLGQLLPRMAGIMAWSLSMSLANSFFMCRYGTWLHQSFSMSAGQVGLVSNAIAGGNLVGNFVTQAVAALRIHVGAAAAFGSGMLSVISALFFMTNGDLGVWLLFSLCFLFFIGTEVGYLSALSHATQCCGTEKVLGMSIYVAAGSVGRLGGDYLAPFLSMPEIFTSNIALYTLATVILIGALRHASDLRMFRAASPPASP